jgi:hypothetical protein
MTTPTAITWTYMMQFNFTNPPKKLLGRSEEIEKKYSRDCQIIKKNGGTEKYLKKKYLSNGNDFCMTHNDYPYYMEDGVKHYVIWFTGRTFDRYNNPSTIERIIEDFKVGNNISEESEYIYYQNIEALRSIPSIPHLHVFIRTT